MGSFLFSACQKDDADDANPGGVPKVTPGEGTDQGGDADYNTVAVFDGEWKNNAEQAFTIKDGIISMGSVTQEIHTYADHFQLANSQWKMKKTGKKETQVTWTKTLDNEKVHEVIWTLIDYDTDVEAKLQSANEEFGDDANGVQKMMDARHTTVFFAADKDVEEDNEEDEPTEDTVSKVVA